MFQTVSIALVTVIENNTDNINSNNGHFEQQRLYFDEALLCFKSWRKNGGNLSGIKIYAICPSKNTLSASEQLQLKELNVEYIEEYMPETETFQFGFYNVPLAMAWAEKNLKEDLFIHTDLDMTLIKPLDDTVFNAALSGKIICGQYDEIAVKDQRKSDESWGLPFDTGFMINLRKLNFYEEYNNQMMELLNTDNDINPYDIEEYIIDRMYNTDFDKFTISPIQKYQIGEGYPNISEFSDEDLKSVYFWHEHILNKEKDSIIKQRVTYSKRMRAIN